MQQNDPWAAFNPRASQQSGPVFGAPPAPKDPLDQQYKVGQLQGQQRDAEKFNFDKGRFNYEQGQDANDRTRNQQNDAFSHASTLRGQYDSDPRVKSFLAAMPGYVASLKTDATPQGDMSLITGYAKMLDPESVVREGEFNAAANTDSTFGKILASLKKEMGEGGLLRPEVRERLRAEMRNRADQMIGGYNAARSEYRDLANRYHIAPEEVIRASAGNPYADQIDQIVAQMRGGDQRASGLQLQTSEQIPDAFRMSGDQAKQFTSYLSRNKDKLTPESMSAAYEAITGYPLDPQHSQEVIAFLAKGGDPAKIGVDYSKTDAAATLNAQKLAQASGPAGASDLITQGMTFGLSDEAGGVGNMLANAVAAPFSENTNFDPVGAYTAGRDADRMRLNAARENMGWGGTALEIGGGILGGGMGVRNALAGPTSLGTRMLEGAKMGGGMGAAAGFGYGEGPNSLLSAAGGAAAGGALGAAIPVVGQVISNRVGGLARMTGRDPALPRRIVSDAIEADGNTPQMAGRMLDEAQSRGSPMMLADTGENARGLLASVGRQPGPGRRMVQETVGNRQNAQAERISEAVARDLGPTANIREMGDELISQARTAAAPLYDKAFSNPGASSVKLDDLALRPSFRKALFKATDLAAEEGVDPTSIGVQFDAAGDPIIDRVPSYKTLDYIKRGLDDVLEGYRDKTTGKLVLDEQGRATLATRQSLVARMDKLNPDYKAAREAYAGPAAMRDALEKGAKALSKSPDDIMAMMKPMGDGEQEAFRLGVRKAITDVLASRRDGGDKVSVLMGTPKLRATLTRVFGGSANFQRFVQTLEDEAAMSRTHRSVFGNSATAERMAQDAQTNDSGLAETAMDAALRGGKDGVWSALVSGLQKLREVDRFGAGEAGQRTRESVAALLSETDPAVLRDLVRAAQEATRQQAIRTARAGRAAVSTSKNTGRVIGMGIGSATKQRP